MLVVVRFSMANCLELFPTNQAGIFSFPLSGAGGEKRKEE